MHRTDTAHTYATDEPQPDAIEGPQPAEIEGPQPAEMEGAQPDAIEGSSLKGHDKNPSCSGGTFFSPSSQLKSILIIHFMNRLIKMTDFWPNSVGFPIG